MEKILKVLLVDDNPGHVRLVQELLTGTDGAFYDIEPVSTLNAGLALFGTNRFDAILLDLNLPDSTGLDTLDRVRAAEPSVPIIIQTNLDDESVAFQAVQRGAQDYLVKGGADPELLTRTINHAIERKHAENKLKEASELVRKHASQLDTIFETMPDAVIFYDANGRPRKINAAAAKLIGIDRDITNIDEQTIAAVIEKRNVRLMNGPHPTVNDMFFKRALAGETVAGDQFVLTDPQGSDRILEVTAGLVKSENQCDGVVVVWRDVTEREQVAEMLRQSEHKFANMFYGNAAAMSLTNIDSGIIMDVSKSWCKVFGFSRDEVIGQPSTDFSIWRNEEERREAIRELKEYGAFHDRETEFVRKNGEVWTALLSSEIIQIDESPVAVNSLIDITDRKRNEMQLWRSLDRLALLSQTAGDLLQESDPQSAVKTLCENVMDHLGCQMFLNFLVDEESGKLHLNAHAGIPPKEARKIEWLDFDAAVCGCFARDERRVIAKNILASPDERTGIVKSFGVRAYACHPLIGPGRSVIGTLSFGTNNRDEFSEEDISLMKAVTDQVAAAMVRMKDEQALRKSEIKQRQLLESMTDTAALLETLNDINNILGSSLEFDQIMTEAMVKATEALHAESSFLAMADDGSYKFRFTFGTDIDTPIGGRLLAKNAPVASEVLECGRLLAVSDLPGDPGFDRRCVKKLHLQSAISAPLEFKGVITGVIAFRYHSRSIAFNEAQIDFVEKLAASLSLALENSRLYREERGLRAHVQGYAAQLSLLHSLGLSLNRETDKRKLLGTLLTGAAELTGAGVGGMILVDKGKTDLVSMYYAPWYDQRCSVLKDTSGLHRRIENLLKTSQELAMRIDDIDSLPEGCKFPPEHLPLEGLLIGALRDTRGRALGYFMLSKKTDGSRFSMQDEEIASLLAAQGSVALVSLDNFEREHLIASTLQDALLPDVPVRGDIDIGIYYRSASHVSRLGGDFYDFIELDGNKLAVLIGDVCGKGLEAAKSTAMIKYTVRAFMEASPDPGRCLTMLNQAVMNQISMDKFVTLTLAVFDPLTHRMEYASAGHPPIVMTRDSHSELLESDRSVPIGVINGYKYSTKTARTSNGCSLAMYTDGLIEARPVGGEPFGQERLLAAISGHGGGEAQQLAEMLSDRAIEYAGQGVKDDICVLILKL